MDGFESEMKDFELNTLLNREPVKLLEDRGDMIKYRSFGDDAGSRILNQLELMEGLLRETKQQ